MFCTAGILVEPPTKIISSISLIANPASETAFLQGSKAYTGIIQLGATTNTDDMQGEIIESKVWPLITENDINFLLENFRGEISQKPPIFSSVHIKGERAYKKARKGEKCCGC